MQSLAYICEVCFYKAVCSVAEADRGDPTRAGVSLRMNVK